MLVHALLCVVLATTASASQGDRLPEFTDCVTQCLALTHCDEVNVFEQIEHQRMMQQEQDADADYAQEHKNANGWNLIQKIKRQLEEQHADEQQQSQQQADEHEVGKHDGHEPGQQVDYSTNNNAAATVRYSLEDFTLHYQISPIAQLIFRWDCKSDCNYKCQQFVTNNRDMRNLPMVQFYGKWPFKRVWGFTEFFSAVFSIGNLYINWHNLHKVLKQYYKNKKHDWELACMYKQYLYLLIISIIGWFFSTLFHIRDNRISETLDYLGAAAIIMANFNAIVIRVAELFRSDRRQLRRGFQMGLVLIWCLHVFKLSQFWDYNYNMIFNVFFGISALILWIAHSIRVNQVYAANDHIYSNSIQLLPFETKILTKLNFIGIISKTKFIPLIPIFLNIWLLMGMTFEIFDFEPWERLIDGHAIWHLFTIFPTIIWFDWNIWDMEMYTVSSDLNKFN